MIESNDLNKAIENAKEFQTEWEVAKPYNWTSLVRDIGTDLPEGFEARMSKTKKFEAFLFRDTRCGGLIVTSAYSRREIVDALNEHINSCPARRTIINP